MLQKVRAILAGVGGRGIWPVRQMAGDSPFTAVAMVDVREENLVAASAVNGLDQQYWYKDLNKALDSVEADCVVICSPTVTHASFARAAMERGLHVLVEKAMTNSLSEARDLVSCAEKAGVQFCVAQNYRFFPVFQEVKRILSDPEDPHHPGPIEVVDLIHHRYRPNPNTLTYKGAMVWDMSCHHFDLMDFFFGVPLKAVSSRAHNPTWSSYSHPANLYATLEYQNGVICQYGISHAGTLTNLRLLLQGPRGALEVDLKHNLYYHGIPAAQFQSSEPVRIHFDNTDGSVKSVRSVLQLFYDQIVTGRESEISGRNNLRIIEACEWVLLASEQKRELSRSGFCEALANKC